jgi:hypothetical protein
LLGKEDNERVSPPYPQTPRVDGMRKGKPAMRWKRRSARTMCIAGSALQAGAELGLTPRRESPNRGDGFQGQAAAATVKSGALHDPSLCENPIGLDPRTQPLSKQAAYSITMSARSRTSGRSTMLSVYQFFDFLAELP